MINVVKTSSSPGRYGSGNLVRAWRVALSQTMILPKTRFLKVRYSAFFHSGDFRMGKTMGNPWENTEVSWGFHGDFMRISWGFHEDFMRISWGLKWDPMNIFIGFRWHGNFMGLKPGASAGSPEVVTPSPDFAEISQDSPDSSIKNTNMLQDQWFISIFFTLM